MRRIAPPPRHVPVSLRFHSYCNWIWQTGFTMLVAGVILAAFFLSVTDLSFTYLLRETSGGLGVVTGVEWTSAAIDDDPIVAVHYTFSVRGQSFRGVSYGTTSPRRGETVTIEYVRSDPATSRIAGMHSKHFPGWMILVAGFPIFGVLLMVRGRVEARRRNHLLMHGVPAEAELLDMQEVNSGIEGKRAWELRFQFVLPTGRRRETVVRTMHPDALTDDLREILLYDRRDASSTLLLDEPPSMMLHTRPTAAVDENGQLRGDPLVYLNLLLPVIAAFMTWLFATFYFELM